MGDNSLFQELGDYIRLSKDAVTLLKTSYPLLPQSSKKAETEKAIEAIENALKRTDAALAQKLGYHLCQCQFPPSIMLWVESQKAHVCQNPACGKRTNFNRDLSGGGGKRDDWLTW